jgi:hypothetical protein
MRRWVVVRITEQVIEIDSDSPAEALAIAKHRLDRPFHEREERWKIEPLELRAETREMATPLVESGPDPRSKR